MKEKIKVIIGIIIFILVLVAIMVFFNRKNNLQKYSNNNELTGSAKDIIEVNDNNFEPEVINSLRYLVYAV